MKNEVDAGDDCIARVLGCLKYFGLGLMQLFHQDLIIIHSELSFFIGCVIVLVYVSQKPNPNEKKKIKMLATGLPLKGPGQEHKFL